MSYSIETAGKDKIVLIRDSVGINKFLFIGIGILFSGIGALLIKFMKHQEPPFCYFGYLFMLFGLIAIYAGSNLSKQTKKTIPKFIIFDNRKGYVQVQFADDQSDCTYIPYNEINDFHIKVKTETQSSNNSRSGGFTTYYSYHPMLRKKDGSEWELNKLNSESKAQEFVNTLNTNLASGKAPERMPEPVLTSKIEKESGRDKVSIRWRNHSGFALVFLILFSVLFLGMLYLIMSSSLTNNQMSGFMISVAGFIVLVFIFIIFTKVKKIVKDSKTRYGFSIDSTNFNYFEEDNAGELRNSRLIPLEDIQGISFNFQPSEATEQVTPLYVHTKEQHAEQAKNTTAGLQLIKQLFSPETLKLDLSNLNVIEKAELQRWIKNTIQKKSDTLIL